MTLLAVLLAGLAAVAFAWTLDALANTLARREESDSRVEARTARGLLQGPPPEVERVKPDRQQGAAHVAPPPTPPPAGAHNRQGERQQESIVSVRPAPRPAPIVRSATVETVSPGPTAHSPEPPAPVLTPNVQPAVPASVLLEPEADPLVVFDGRSIPEDAVPRQGGEGATLFDEIQIHDDVWAWFQRHPTLRPRVSSLVQTIEHFYANDQRLHSNRIRKVDGDHYKIRLTKSLRLAFALSERDGRVRLTFRAVLTHDEGVAVHDHGLTPAADDDLRDLPADWGPRDLAVEVGDDLDATTAPYVPLFRVWNAKDEARLAADHQADLRWRLSPEQAAFRDVRGPLLLKGSAGSGKTTIAIYRLLSWGQQDGRRLYLTYTDLLRDHAERLYRQLVDPERDRALPSFQTIDDLCRRLAGEEAARFHPSRRFGLDQFVEIPALRQAPCPVPLSLLWEEIRGVIKGAHRVVESDGVALAPEVYVSEIPKNQSLVAPEDRPAAYAAFEKYQKWLTEREWWDDLDLARTAYRRVADGSADPAVYDQLVVDEVQDLTTFHIALLLRLSRDPTGLYLTGDAQQVIHPSRFEWDRIKEQLYHHVEAFKRSHHYYGEAPREVAEITANYRSPRAIVDLANAVAAWRNGRFRERNATLRSVRDGDHVYTLAPAPRSTWTENEMFSVRLMVLVPSEAAVPAARREFGVGRVYTVHQAKGLEADFVLLWGFFDPDDGAWDHGLISARHPERDGVAQRLRYQVSLFNVAITRGRENLFVVDHKLPNDWSPLSSAEFVQGDAAHERLRAILDLRSRAEDYIEFGRELEKRGPEFLEQAAANYFDGGDAVEGNRCLGQFFERRGAFSDAGAHYEKARLFARAASCFDQAEEFDRAFRIVLAAEDREGMPTVDQFFEDDKRLAKLGGDIPLDIADAALAPHSVVPASTLYQYSMTRTRLLREGVRRPVRAVGRVLTSKAGQESTAAFDDALRYTLQAP